MELQSVFKGWDNLDRLYGRCLNQFEAKRTRDLCYGNQTAGSALFCQMKMILCYGRFEGSKARVSGSRGCEKLVSKACTSWFSLMFQLCEFWHVSCIWSKSGQVMQSKPVQAIHQLAYYALGPQVGGFNFLHKMWLNAQGCCFDIKQDLSKNGNVAFSI